MITADTAKQALTQSFKSLNIKATVIDAELTPPLCRFSIVLRGTTRIKKIESLSKEIAAHMKSKSVPIISEDFTDGKFTMEFMFDDHPIVNFDTLLSKTDFDKERSEKLLPILIGATDINDPVVLDIATMPHLLVAGSTGSGKSHMLHSIIKSLMLQGPKNIRLALIDPKIVEFSKYFGSDYLRYNIATTEAEVSEIFDDLLDTLKRRLQIFANSGVRDLAEYRQYGGDLPYIVVIIDELADLIRAKRTGFSTKLCSLAERSRAAGIHIIVATQHPSRDIVTGPIKANFVSRICCKVPTQVHSRVVLDANGAEKLLGKGDALLIDGDKNLLRFKGCLVSFETNKLPAVIKPKEKTWYQKLFKK